MTLPGRLRPTPLFPQIHRQASLEEIESSRTLPPELKDVARYYLTIRAGLDQDVVGHSDTKTLMLLATACCGHMYVISPPGTAKTRLGQSLAYHLGVSWGKLPCDAEKQPSDATGWHYMNQETGKYEFMDGPVLNGICQADEFNRAMPTMHSGLLEAMQEGTVTVDNRTYTVPYPRILIATANPIDRATTPPSLSAMDRFMLSMTVSFLASKAEQLEYILNAERYDTEIRPLGTERTLPPDVRRQAEVRAQQIRQNRALIRDHVTLAPEVAGYILAFVRMLRSHNAIEMGAGTKEVKDGGGGDRALRDLVFAVKAHAVLCGARGFVEPDDAMAMARPVLAHRLAVQGKGRLSDAAFVESARVVGDVIDQLDPPDGFQAGSGGRR
jgi:MoxR-like ATPase